MNNSLTWAKALLCKNGDNLTKKHMESLKYKGGPGDSNSCQPKGKKIKKRIGGKVNNANKITIYESPGMFDVIHK